MSAFSTFLTATTPLNLVRGRPWAVPFIWQNPPYPGGSPIDITGFTLTANIFVNSPQATAIPVTITVTSAPDGQFTCSLNEDATPQVPDSQFSTLGLTIVDTLGNTTDASIPINVETPPPWE